MLLLVVLCLKPGLTVEHGPCLEQINDTQERIK